MSNPVPTPPALSKICFLLPVAPFLALLLWGAHQLRMGEVGLAFAMVFLACMLWLHSAWLRFAGAVALMTAGYGWAATASMLIQSRMVVDADWHRLALIMGGVILFTCFSMVLLLGDRAAQRYHRNADTAGLQAVTFILAVMLLWSIRQRAWDMSPLLLERFLPEWGGLEVVLAGVYAAWNSRVLYILVSTRHPLHIWLLFLAQLAGVVGVSFLTRSFL